MRAYGMRERGDWIFSWLDALKQPTPSLLSLAAVARLPSGSLARLLLTRALLGAARIHRVRERWSRRRSARAEYRQACTPQTGPPSSRFLHGFIDSLSSPPRWMTCSRHTNSDNLCTLARTYNHTRSLARAYTRTHTQKKHSPPAPSGAVDVVIPRGANGGLGV